jgi:hypothetical protein
VWSSAHSDQTRPVGHASTAIYRTKQVGSTSILELRPRRPRLAIAEEPTQLELHAFLRPRPPRARPQVMNPQAQLSRHRSGPPSRPTALRSAFCPARSNSSRIGHSVQPARSTSSSRRTRSSVQRGAYPGLCPHTADDADCSRYHLISQMRPWRAAMPPEPPPDG